MHLEKFNAIDHLHIVQGWLRDRDVNHIPSERDFPEHGVVAFVDTLPIAAAFLRRIEGGMGLFDGLVSNPKATSEHRHEALDWVIAEVLETAKQLKIKSILAFSSDIGTIKRATKQGLAPVEGLTLLIYQGR